MHRAISWPARHVLRRVHRVRGLAGVVHVRRRHSELHGIRSVLHRVGILHRMAIGVATILLLMRRRNLVGCLHVLMFVEVLFCRITALSLRALPLAVLALKVLRAIRSRASLLVHVGGWFIHAFVAASERVLTFVTTTVTVVLVVTASTTIVVRVVHIRTLIATL